jgi:hypothetical protein
MIANNEVDFGRTFTPDQVIGMDAGGPITALAGLHAGCWGRTTSATSPTCAEPSSSAFPGCNGIEALMHAAVTTANTQEGCGLSGSVE